MKTMKALGSALSVVVFSLSIQTAAAALEAGFSSVDITPYPSAQHEDPQTQGYESAYGRIFIGGFGPYIPIPGREARWAAGVHDPIYARAVAVRSGGKTLVMISTDLPGLTWKYINPVRRELSRKHGIPEENIIVASTHNHSGPDAAGYWVTFIRRHQSRYTHQLMKWVSEAGTRAIGSLQPAEMKTLTTDHFACFDRKTKEMKRPKDCRFPLNRADYDLPGGDQYDYYLTQMDKRDPNVLNNRITIQHYVKPGTRETIGTFINWHSHPDTVDSKFISSDFPGYLREFVEAELGGTAVYFSGTVGCQIGPNAPIPLWDKNRRPVYTGETGPSGQRLREFFEGDDWIRIRSIGYEIGNEVVQAIRTQPGGYRATAGIDVRSRPVDIAPTNFLHLLATGSVWRYDVEPEDELFWYPGRCMGKYGCVRTDVERVVIGDLTILTGPGEIDPVYVYGRPESRTEWRTPKKVWKAHFKAYPSLLPHLKTPHVAILGQAQNYLSYMFPESDFVGSLRLKHPNHYEDMVTVNRHFGDDVGNVWHELMGSPYRYNQRRILPRVKSASGESHE